MYIYFCIKTYYWFETSEYFEIMISILSKKRRFKDLILLDEAPKSNGLADVGHKLKVYSSLLEVCLITNIYLH